MPDHPRLGLLRFARVAMDPYRTPPSLGPEVEPELDRLPVALRLPVMRGGWIVVTPSALRFEPRIGHARTAPLADGTGALRLSFALDPARRFHRRRPTAAQTILSWQYIAASRAYLQPLAHAPHAGIIAHAHAHSFARGVSEDRTFATIIDGDRLLAIEAEAAFHVCFQLPRDLDLPDRSGRLLGRALAWLGPESLFEMFGRLREHQRPLLRAFTRQQVRDRPSYTVEERRFELLGTSSRDAIALEPTLAESVMLGRWAAGEHVR